MTAAAALPLPPAHPGTVSRPRPIFVHLSRVLPTHLLCRGRCGRKVDASLVADCCPACTRRLNADRYPDTRDASADDRDRLATETDAARWALSGVR